MTEQQPSNGGQWVAALIREEARDAAARRAAPAPEAEVQRLLGVFDKVAPK